MKGRKICRDFTFYSAVLGILFFGGQGELFSLTPYEGGDIPSLICVPEDYPTIQQGIDAAQWGDTVLVSPGSYFDSQVRYVGDLGWICANIFMKSGVNVIGSGPGTRIEGNDEGNPTPLHCVILAYEVEDASLRSFTITGYRRENPPYQYGGEGLQVVRSELLIEENVFDVFVPPYGCQFLWPAVILDNSASVFQKNIIFHGEDVSLTSRYGDVSMIYNNTLYGDSDCIGVGVETESSPLIANNIFCHLWQGVGVLACSQSPVLRNNCFWEVPEPYWNCNPGIGDIFQDPLFVMEPVGNVFDFHLQDDSPCIDAGKNVGLPFYGRAPDIGRYEFAFPTPCKYFR